MKLGIAALIAAMSLTTTQSSFAFESEEASFGYQDAPIIKSIPIKIDSADATRFDKFQAALDTIGIPAELDPDFSDFVHAGEVNQADVQKNIPYIDPELGLSRYLSFSNGNLQMFRDFFKSMISLDYLEYQQALSTSNSSNDSSELMQHLKTVALQTQTQSAFPLAGLKILIDPGHMGGDDWDKDTGKFVSVNGRKVSEGSLTLWTALLTAKKLEKLGAIVQLTREKLGTVSSEDPKNFNSTPFINQYFYNSMDDWMAPYLTQSIDQIKLNIKNASEVQKAFTDAQKLQFFITGADLEARSKMVDTFKPDVTLDIHFDASKIDALQNNNQSLEAFIPGSFAKTETGSRRVRAMALKHLLEVRRWNQSVELADEITQSMSSSLNIPRLSSPDAFSALKVRDGVYARNLYINRRALSSLVVYLECLHYDHVNEHKRLSVLDQTGFYHATSFQYPNRLNDIADGIENGFIEYFKNLKL